ncbi:unnamed protein product [Didymodactylos carnosus]|uniref:Uncharacterized protein n=1 Tax=Didymodactylos carnosus TaxID=1234261 RepID=A0A813UL64_9BILA|nr:unnamed protein product [Didymodactylos carnosus]CAF0903651.1 unnamed protein product [Didymodactylos carnosus]CAF3615183.1 unnamed protein product [Didymodactylos carnosus]CAF3683855.1 unnamed protein product [Didymodactylos carnosus]
MIIANCRMLLCQAYRDKYYQTSYLKMASDDKQQIHDDIVEQILSASVEQVSINENLQSTVNQYNICDDCSICDLTVQLQESQQHHSTTTDENNTEQQDEKPRHLYLCSTCSERRRQQARKVLQDLEKLQQEVEERLSAIEKTERELDEWRDQQLQKNREFWDEYRRQVENFSACRIRTLQYEYQMREMKTQLLMKRLKRAKYIAEHIEQLRDELHIELEPSILELLCSEKLKQNWDDIVIPTTESSTTPSATTTTTPIQDKQKFLDEICHELDKLAFLDKLNLGAAADEEEKEELQQRGAKV